MTRIRGLRVLASRLGLVAFVVVFILELGASAGSSSAYLVSRTESSFSDLLEKGEPWREAMKLSWGSAEIRTRFWALWSSEGLALRFEASDPSPWFTMDERDDPIWNEEVVEIFLDLDGSGTHYAEYELNPANTFCDLEMLRGIPDIEGNIDWNHEGARHRVRILKDSDGETLGWEARLLLPWAGFRTLSSASDWSFPPEPGSAFSFNAFRIERPGGATAPDRDVQFMPYIPTGNASFHVPAVFHQFRFVQ